MARVALMTIVSFCILTGCHASNHALPRHSSIEIVIPVGTGPKRYMIAMDRESLREYLIDELDRNPECVIYLRDEEKRANDYDRETIQMVRRIAAEAGVSCEYSPALGDFPATFHPLNSETPNGD